MIALQVDLQHDRLLEHEALPHQFLIYDIQHVTLGTSKQLSTWRRSGIFGVGGRLRASRDDIAHGSQETESIAEDIEGFFMCTLSLLKCTNKTVLLL